MSEDDSEELQSVSRLSDQQLIEGLELAATGERVSMVTLIVHLIEFKKRKLHAPMGYSSSFIYCTRKLGYPEEAAYKRIRAARAAARFPVILRLMRSGRVHLSAVVTLNPHLTKENHRDLLERAAGLSHHELEFLAASLAPKPDLADHVRLLDKPAVEPMAPETGKVRHITPELAPPHAQAFPTFSAAGTGQAPPQEAGQASSNPMHQAGYDRVQPLCAQRVRIAFTASRAL